MIKQVSWTEYFTVVAVLCAAYYVVIVLLYYRKEVIDFFSGRRMLPGTATAPPTSSPDPAGNYKARTEATPEEKLFSLTNQLMQELNPVFGNEYVKGELMTALQVILLKYSMLRGTAFQVSVNNYIQMESENQCSVSLSEQELRALWNG